MLARKATSRQKENRSSDLTTISASVTPTMLHQYRAGATYCINQSSNQSIVLPPSRLDGLVGSGPQPGYLLLFGSPYQGATVLGDRQLRGAAWGKGEELDLNLNACSKIQAMTEEMGNKI